jgi:hypothetical protein
VIPSFFGAENFMATRAEIQLLPSVCSMARSRSRSPCSYTVCRRVEVQTLRTRWACCASRRAGGTNSRSSSSRYSCSRKTARPGQVTSQAAGILLKESLRLIHDHVSQVALPLEGEHLASVLVIEPRSVAELDRELVPVQDLRAVRNMRQFEG